jgi:fermentation-respiration switch protein FrsA (DUF1100 family)
MGRTDFLDFEPLTQAPVITTPTMVIHSDGSAFPDQAKRFFKALPADKELVWAGGNHFDYYGSPTHVNNAVANAARLFRTHLTEAAPS